MSCSHVSLSFPFLRNGRASHFVAAALGLALWAFPVAVSGAAEKRHVTLLVSAEVRPSCEAEVDGLRVRLICGQDALDSVRVDVAGLVLIPESLVARTDETRTFAFARLDETVAALSLARLFTQSASDDILITIVF